MPTLLPLLCASLALMPQGTAEVSRFKNALDATKLNYGPASPAYSINFTHANNRRQTVYADEKPTSVGELRSHFIYTIVWVGDSRPEGSVLKNVFSQSKKQGYFYLNKDNNSKWSIRFGAHFDAAGLQETSSTDDALVKNLKDVIYLVDAVGEETDKMLNGEKDIH